MDDFLDAYLRLSRQNIQSGYSYAAGTLASEETDRDAAKARTNR